MIMVITCMLIPWLKPIFYEVIPDILHFCVSKVVDELERFFAHLIMHMTAVKGENKFTL